MSILVVSHIGSWLASPSTPCVVKAMEFGIRASQEHARRKIPRLCAHGRVQSGGAMAQTVLQKA